MKRSLLILALCLTIATAFSDDFIVSKDVAQDHNGNKVRLSATKNSDGTYTLSSAGGGGAVTNAGVFAVQTSPTKTGTGTADVILKATTAATGTNWTSFSSQTCSVLTVINVTGTTLSVRIGGAGESVQLPNGSGQTFTVTANASEIGVQRTDTSNTQVDVKAVASK